MKPFKTTRLLKPLTEDIKLEDGEWVGETVVNFYIPIHFNPDEYFAGINVNTGENNDYINLYLNYDFERDSIELYINYANNSGVKEGCQDFGIEVIEWDLTTDEYLKKLLLPLRDEFLLEMWNDLADIPFDEEDTPHRLVLAQDWWLFEKGTDRGKIWSFFDKLYSEGVYTLIYKN